MARETKVGLVAGLAFIICFAVILSNRGRLVPPPQDPPPRFQYAGAERNTQPVANPRPTQRQNTQRQNTPLNRGPRPPRQRPVGNEGRTTNNSVDHRRPEGRVAEPPPRYSGASAHRQQRPHPTKVADGRRSEGRSADGDRVHKLEQRLEELSRELALQGRSDYRLANVTNPQSSFVEAAPLSESSDRTVTDSAAPATLVMGHHKVVSGDTLSRIAATHYGSKSRRLLDALVDANRGVLSDPNVLRVGMELTLPIVAGYEQRNPETSAQTKEPRGNDAGSSRPRGKTHESRPTRWYQIKKNDRYVSIARNELGDATRWPEIFDLNKKAFPDPGRIRPGVRIKLPAVAVADSR